MFLKVSQKIEKVVAVITVFLMPTQLALHFWPAYAFVFGIRVDYLSPAIYLTDVLFLFLLMLWFINDKTSFLSFIKKYSAFFVLFLLFVLLNLLFSTSFPVTLVKWLKLLEVALFGFYIYLRKYFVGEKLLIKTIFLSAIFFSIVGIIQFFIGRTTGLLYLIGERSFNISTPGIALVEIAGQNFLRAYSTFPHPNSLAGFLGLTSLFVIGSVLKKNKLFFVGMAVVIFGIVLTFSASVFLSLVFVALTFLGIKKYFPQSLLMKTFLGLTILFSLFLPFLSKAQFKSFGFSKNLLERIDLSYLSGKMISDRFLMGEGFNTFIVNIPRFNTGLQSPWLLQPVHNIYLLIFSELGVTGLIFFCCLIYLAIQKFLQRGQTLYLLIFSFILFTGLTDHYWITIQQNMVLISFFLGLSLSDNGKLG